MSNYKKLEEAVERLSNDVIDAGQAYEFVMVANDMAGFIDAINAASLGNSYNRVFDAFMLQALSAIFRIFDTQINTGSLKDIYKKLKTNSAKVGCLRQIKTCPGGQVSTEAEAEDKYCSLVKQISKSSNLDEGMKNRMKALRNSIFAHSNYGIKTDSSFTLEELNSAIIKAENGSQAALLAIKGSSIDYIDFRCLARKDGEKFWNVFVNQ